MGIAALILGILAIVFSWFNWYAIIGLVLGIAGIILGAIATKKKASCGVAGLVVAIIGTVFCGIMFLACTACIACANAAASSPTVQNAVTDAINQAAEEVGSAIK